MKLTSHTAAMDLMTQFPSNGVVPRQRFGPIPQFLMSTASKQRTKTLMAHRQVMENLQHVKQYGNWYGEQHNRLQGAHHLESVTLIKLE